MLTITTKQARKLKDKNELLHMNIVRKHGRFSFEILSAKGIVYTLRQSEPSELLTYATLDGAAGIATKLNFDKFNVRM